MYYAMAMNVMYAEEAKREIEAEKNASMSIYDRRRHEKEVNVSMWQFIGLLFI
ncbi:hypothetical protein OAP63_00575 [Vibrio sp.]|uniref:hypothetical protein n=1 Tax=Vibrio viridaestus TaxID=2487322 RepID=UPI00140B11B6|nr:hypothetical protein [Vibrio viridaestus]MDC0609202.1 hypothetical protein [Vibrio sp.]